MSTARRPRKIPINTTLDPRLVADVDEKARELELPRSEIIRQALRLWLATQREEEEIDQNLARIAAERAADPDDALIPHEEVMKRLGLSR